MKQSVVQKLLVVGIMMFLLGGCDKKSSTGPEEVQPTIPTVTIQGPNTASTDLNAEITKSAAMSLNYYSQMGQGFAIGEGNQSGNTWTWTFPMDGVTITFTSTRQNDGSFIWKVVYNGTSGQVTYNNWTSMEGSSTADGKNGNWKFYEVNSTVLYAEFIWTTSGETLTATLKTYVHGTLENQVVVVNNSNGTGELRMYDGTIMTFKAVWQTNGTGQWWYYDSTGVVTSSGTWS